VCYYQANSKLSKVKMKGYYLGAGAFVLATLLLQGPIQNETLGLPMSGLQSAAFGYLCGLTTIMASGMYSFWRNHPFNVGELPDWLLSEQSPLNRRNGSLPAKSEKSAMIEPNPNSKPMTFEPSLEELPIPPISRVSRKAKQSMLKSLNNKIPGLPKPRIFELPEELPCPYSCEAEQTGQEAGK